MLDYLIYMAAWVVCKPDRARLLAVAVPLFLLFCAVELNIIVHPGETVFPDARDELLAFFKARMLQAGYVASIAALVVLYSIALLVPRYVGLLLPAASSPSEESGVPAI